MTSDHQLGTDYVNAAQYLRMSTEHQRYSIANQASEIAYYADSHRYRIVATYEDQGRSGLNLGGRPGLMRLLQDVCSGSSPFKAVLVYDVSRLGRFQDADESAHYEYLCRQAGVSVVYCAEGFQNDGSPLAAIVKGIKRAMAGEYSRELSAKVYRGQQRLISMGYRQGGTAGYGLRRLLVDSNGQPKYILEYGQAKSLQTDRVILVPGPQHEIDTVRWMYQSFIEGGFGEAKIAQMLNNKGIRNGIGNRWTRTTVHQVLSNEKYIGHNVWNRASAKLQMKRVHNSPERWLRVLDSFAAIVEPELFAAVQAVRSRRAQIFTDQEMLDCLATLWRETGYLSGGLIDRENARMPGSLSYRKRFGSLFRAYNLIGYHIARESSSVEIGRASRQIRHLMSTWLEACASHAGIRARYDQKRSLMDLGYRLKLRIMVVSCQSNLNDKPLWRLHRCGNKTDLVLAVRLDANNTYPLDYYLLPPGMHRKKSKHLRYRNSPAIDAYRFEDFDSMFGRIVNAVEECETSAPT